MGETRKLAAIMAVDVVGYSRLMGEDEAGTAQAVRRCREAAIPIVAALGGRIVQLRENARASLTNEAVSKVPAPIKNRRSFSISRLNRAISASALEAVA